MTESDPLYFLERVWERLKTSVHADTSDPHRLSIGFIGGDLPMFPPLAVLLATLVALLTWYITGKRYRFVPAPFKQLTVRLVLVAVGIGSALKLAHACNEELNAVGTVPNFAAVSKVASNGPFAWTRNGMYLAVFAIQISMAVGLDTGWLLASWVAMMLYLDRIVVPAEERFLTNELGVEYQQYCDTVPRWLF